MIIVLLTLFTIALTITFAGLFLSPKAQTPTSRKVSYATRATTAPRASTRETAREREFRAGSRMYQATERVYRSQTLPARKYVMEFEPEPRRGTRIAVMKEPRRDTVQLEDGLLSLGNLLNVKRFLTPRSNRPMSWLGIVLILVALFGVGLVAMRPLFAGTGVIGTFAWSQPFGAAPTPVPAVNKADTTLQDLLAGTTGASKSLARVYQLDPAQYGSSQDFNTWAPSACSAASMTEVINSYGHNYKIADILKVEAGLGQISPELGLLRPTGIDTTVDKFGFKAIHLNSPSVDDIIKIANTGKPVIVSFPPQRWTGGHILVLRGGRDNNVYLADSSQFNMTIVSRATFLKYWGGFAVVVMPNK